MIFMKQLNHFTRMHQKNYTLLTDEKSGHKVSREGVLKTIEWFDTYLNN